MELKSNSTPKPTNWIWKVTLSPKENERLINMLAAFSGDKLRHGEYRVAVSKGQIVGVSTIHTTVVDVKSGEPDKKEEGVLIEKSAKKALENKA
jgi:hypothetical protein